MSTAVTKLQLLQQNLQQVQMQKQQLQDQLTELDTTLSELQHTEQAYKIIGKVMLAKSRSELLDELQQKREFMHIRLNNFIKQEEKINQNIEEVQQQVLSELKPKNK